MTLAGIELRYLVDQISGRVRDYYVSNIYGVTKDSLLFKLHHTEKADLFMMISTSGVWLTSVKIEQIEPNRLLKRLRSDLLRLRLKEIRQIGSERIAYFVFEGFGKQFVLVGEFFGDGNILLCNEQMKVLALQHSVSVRHRKLGVGLEYVAPPQNGLDIFNISEADFGGLGATDMVAARWIGRTLGLPKKYAEGVFKIAGIDSKTAGNQLGPDQIKKIFDATRQLVSDVVTGNHRPVIIRGEKTEVLPVQLDEPDQTHTQAGDFIEALDSVFSETIVEHGKSVQSGSSDKKIKELQTQISEQEKAIETVRERSESITKVANLLHGMVAAGITSIEDGRASEILAGHGAGLITEKGVPLMVVSDQKIRIKLESSLQSIASVLFDEAKRQSRAIGSIEEIRDKTRKKLEKVQNMTQLEKDSITVAEIRKKNWYERYRWFFTSDGYLAIGGRDAASNSAVVRKHLEGDDRIFHGDIFGSPFFILKDAGSAPATSMAEVAHATVCFSRAWREGMYGLSSFWVNPGQVKKSAPSGQFLPKGSFTIEGQRNFIKAETLRLAVGVIVQDGDHILTCGPVGPIKKRSVCYAIIEPHGLEMVDAAKKIRTEFANLEEDIIRNISIDDFVRVLPAGKSQVKDVGYGDAR